MRLLFTLFALVLAALARPADVLTSRNNLARTGVNAAETVLTPASVNATTFGKLWTLYADGQVVAQPLYVSGLAVDTSANPAAPRVQGTFDAVLVATMHNTIYLYDATSERPGPEGRNVPLWATWLGKPRPGDGIDMYATNDPEWGILSTPVIDPTKSIVYVVAWHDDGGAAQDYHYRLHALRLKDGTLLAPAAEIQAPGFNPKVQKQRPGLLLTGGVVYIAFGGDGNRGLVLAYDSNTLARTATWSVTPTGENGGIWQAGQAPTADAAGNIYLMTGNGTFGDQGGSSNYGQSFVKLRLEGTTLAVKDHFTPCNAAALSGTDDDLGSSGPVLIPGTDLIVGGGKEGRLYLLSTANMGKHVAPPQPEARVCPNPNVLQEFDATHWHHIHSSPVFWPAADGGRLYVWSEMERLRAYRFANGRIITTNPRLSEYHPPDGMPGGMLSLSSQGGTNGILWAVVPLDGDANKLRGVKGIVLALDAKDVTKTLWTSEQAGARDRLGLFARFVPPTIADGKVFVATYGDEEPLRMYSKTVRPQAFPARYQVVVYGLLPAPPARVDQSRDDVQLVSAAVAAPVAPDTSRCRPAAAQTLDCTEELQRLTGAPSLERVVVPAGYDFAGCRALRVTTAAKQAALPGAVGIGFYSADVTTGQFSANLGRLVPTSALKAVGNAVLKNGQPAVLHEFAALVDCAGAPGTIATKQFKPYMDFAGGPPPTLYRNWDPVAGNYAVGGAAASIDRRAEVLR
jgi:hypothetical protein